MGENISAMGIFHSRVVGGGPSRGRGESAAAFLKLGNDANRGKRFRSIFLHPIAIFAFGQFYFCGQSPFSLSAFFKRGLWVRG